MYQIYRPSPNGAFLKPLSGLNPSRLCTDIHGTSVILALGYYDGERTETVWLQSYTA